MKGWKDFFAELLGFFFKSKREWLGYRPEKKKANPDDGGGLWGCLPFLIVFGFMALAIWQNWN